MVCILLAHALKIYQSQDISHESRTFKSGFCFTMLGPWSMDGISCFWPHKPSQIFTLLWITMTVGFTLTVSCGYGIIMTSLQHRTSESVGWCSIWFGSVPGHATFQNSMAGFVLARFGPPSFSHPIALYFDLSQWHWGFGDWNYLAPARGWEIFWCRMVHVGPAFNFSDIWLPKEGYSALGYIVEVLGTGA